MNHTQIGTEGLFDAVLVDVQNAWRTANEAVDPKGERVQNHKNSLRVRQPISWELRNLLSDDFGSLEDHLVFTFQPLLFAGLKGNPLSPEILSIYNEANGTSKLLTYMLDNLHGK